MEGNYWCVVWRDRRAIGWFRPGPQQVAAFHSGLDLDNPRDMQSILVTAAYRDRGNPALYALAVHDEESGEVVRYYRCNLAWLDSGDDTDGDED